MKYFYGIDRTTDKKNDTHLGEAFLAARISPAQQSQLERTVTEVVELEERSGLPGGLDLLRTILGTLALVVFVGIVRGLSNVTISKAYENAPWLFWLLGICAAAWAVLTLIHRRIRKKVLDTGDADRTERRMEAVLANSWTELGVPADAKEVDVICFRHKWKGDTPKAATRGMETCENTAEVFRVYRKEDTLCFANAEARYEFDLPALKALRKVKKHIVVAEWNKEEPFDKGFYKPYKLTADNYGRIHAKYSGELQLDRQGETWAILLPCYELNYIAALTGLAIAE